MAKTHLSQKLKFDLMTLVQAEYVAKAVTDPEFAKLANIELMSDEINANHVAGCRQALSIVGTKTSAGALGTEVGALRELIVVLQKQTAARIDALEKRVDVYLSGRGRP